jgi:hypothetical protein
VTAPRTLTSTSDLTTTVHAIQRGRATTVHDRRVVGQLPPSPPSGTTEVSALQFLSATNGWGPVERDTSVGENQAGDGRTITMAGTTYQHGLGTNSPSDVALYLDGRCTRLTATVGVDDETGGAGTVTFSVVADGRTLTTTPVLTAKTGPQQISVDTTGAQVLDLVVGEGGDGNGNDHGDWGDARITCG